MLNDTREGRMQPPHFTRHTSIDILALIAASCRRGFVHVHTRATTAREFFKPIYVKAQLSQHGLCLDVVTLPL